MSSVRLLIGLRFHAAERILASPRASPRAACCLPFLAYAKQTRRRLSEAVPDGRNRVPQQNSGLNLAALSELAGMLISTQSFEDLMRAVAELATRTVAPASTCGITLSEGGRVITVASADALALLLDEQQYELDQGPCLQALETGLVVSSTDLSREDRWGGYPSRAVAFGVGSVYSSPLLVEGRAIGALNMYAEHADAFYEDATVTIAHIAAMATATMTAAMRHYDEVTLSDHLRSALSSRSVIDQALGIVIGMNRCSASEAFAVLRTASQNSNIPLRQVAQDLVTRTVGRSV